MKALFCIAVFTFLFLAGSQAQDIKKDKVPETVLSAFTQMFPDAEKAEWEMEKSDYEVSFRFNKVEYSALFGTDGNFIESEQEIEVSGLPADILKVIEQEFPGGKVREAENGTMANKSVYYEVEVKTEKETVDVRISEAGKILSKEIEDKEEDD